MKKILLSLFACIALALTFSSCGIIDATEVLSAEDVGDWCTGRWSGSLEVTSNVPAEYQYLFDISASKDNYSVSLTPKLLKEIINTDGFSVDFVFVAYKQETCVKTNLFKNKLTIEENYTLSVSGSTYTLKSVAKLSKD